MLTAPPEGWEQGVLSSEGGTGGCTHPPQDGGRGWELGEGQTPALGAGQCPPRWEHQEQGQPLGHSVLLSGSGLELWAGRAACGGSCLRHHPGGLKLPEAARGGSASSWVNSSLVCARCYCLQQRMGQDLPSHLNQPEIL